MPSSPAKAHRGPTIAAWVTAQVLAELDRRAVPADALLEAHGLDRRRLGDLDAAVPLATHAAFFRAAAAAADDQALAFMVGRRTPWGAMRVLGHCAAVASTLDEAYRTYGRYVGLISDAATDLTTERGDGHDALVHRRRHPLVLPDDTVALLSSAALFAETAPVRPCRPVALVLDFPEPPHAAALRDAFRVPVAFGAAQAELRFASGALDARIAHADPALHAHLDVLATRQLALRPQEPMGTRVRAAVLTLGFEASRAVDAVARSLSVSGRTLQRQLGLEGTTFKEVRDEVLREEALELLRHDRATVEEVAFRLGFASRTAFHRAVRRWTGGTPRQARGPADAAR